MTIDHAVDRELHEPRPALVDMLAYTMREYARAGGRTAPVFEQLTAALRASELRLPVLPDSVSRVMRLINHPEVDIGELASLVEMDPSLSIKTVGVANSAYYHGVQPAASVSEALMRMGLRNARNIVSAVALRSSLFNIAGYENEAQAIWFHSLYTAVATDALLTEVPPWQDNGFLLGLAHDIGRISILTFAADLKERDPKGAGACPVALHEVADLIHADLGALAVESWHFGDDFSTAVAYHHDPNQVNDHRIVLTRAIRAGDILGRRAERGALVGEDDGDRELMELLEMLGIEPERTGELVREVQAGFEGLAKIS